MNRKSTSGIIQFLESSLVSWSSKKQNTVALSTAEAEYVAAAACCSQVLWIKQQVRDFGIKFKCVPIFCDNTSAICVSKDPIHHSRVKHIHTITSRIIANCCGNIAAVLPIRSNISRKKKKKYKIIILLRFLTKTAAIWSQQIFLNFFLLFNQIYCCGFCQKPQQYNKLIFKKYYLNLLLRFLEKTAAITLLGFY